MKHSKQLFLSGGGCAKGGTEKRLTGRFRCLLEAVMCVVKGDVQCSNDELVLVNKTTLHKLEQDNIDLQHQQQRLRTLLKSERIATNRMLTMLDHLSLSWEKDAFPCGEKLTLAMADVVEELEQFNHIKRLDHATLKKLTEVGLDKYEMYDMLREQSKEEV